ncbi:PREDICTED: elongation of very long chain fatty acids protein AAEL008004-like [Dinoponera quadriceps]|uniref:Elongation of very long chain fatty acids protein n=1 Tax=Dinoponera quadriceps TaxID=609295 RepID=A0A6P3Y5X9_DINQU|nr:PREDICTED: elongation of very long chain fatty acids protein AAEL008004-like [Dinoponera quadriceps]
MFDFGESPIMDWQSMRSFTPMVGSVLVYLFTIFVIIPLFMRNRKAYSLKGFMQCYNIFQVMANFWFSYKIVSIGGSWSVISRYCEPMEKICGDNTIKQLEVVWLAMWLRVIDFIETVVFLLRKKKTQVSFLHVYHHTTTPLFLWAVMKYLFHGHILFMVMLNCCMHTIMYIYYFLSTYESNRQKFYPFKKWITILQMAQILLITLSATQGVLSDCNMKIKCYSIIVFVNGMYNLVLFYNFYKNAYKRSKKE